MQKKFKVVTFFVTVTFIWPFQTKNMKIENFWSQSIQNFFVIFVNFY